MRHFNKCSHDSARGFESWQSHAVTEGNSKRFCIIGDHPSLGSAIINAKRDWSLSLNMNHMLAVSDHLDPTFSFSFLYEILSISTLISTLLKIFSK